MNLNPYQSPATIPDGPCQAGGLRVEGKLLVVQSGAVLPPVCVKTNQPVSEYDLVTRRFTWCSPLVALLALVSGPLLILVYFVARRKCTLTFGILPTINGRYRTFRIVKIVAVFVLFLALFLVAPIRDSTPLVMVILVLFLISVVSLCFGNSPLTVTKYRAGEYWVAGCSRDFLADIQGPTGRA